MSHALPINSVIDSVKHSIESEKKRCTELIEFYQKTYSAAAQEKIKNIRAAISYADSTVQSGKVKRMLRAHNTLKNFR